MLLIVGTSYIMHVNNKIYYHIQRKDPNQPFRKIGDVLTIPTGTKNNFIEGMFDKEYSRYAGEGLYWDSDIICHYSAVQMGFETKLTENTKKYRQYNTRKNHIP